MEPDARNRLTSQLVLLMWAALGLGPIGADWLETTGLGEWPAVGAVAAAPLLGLLAGLAVWVLSGRPRPRAAFLPDWAAVPSLAIGLMGLVTGTASRGHLFVLIFLTVPALIVLLVVAIELRNAGNRTRHPDVVQVTTDLGGMT
ncbi:hypothetical protein [Amycolatopsis sp. NBC_01286]|uniref:hypothetical protein n=1 Tax=Amycolatopsis sp. NBC_01286 TaxID=2903560 RepID=UPI002E12D50A|nr:hypothetical protein OG570_03280 [Amycolatopsis sp. NBC_01286]